MRNNLFWIRQSTITLMFLVMAPAPASEKVFSSPAPASTMAHENKKNPFKDKNPQNLRVYSSVKLPFDPLYLKSMGEYDLALAIHRTMMSYDKGRMASPGIIKSWKFLQEIGEYQVSIDNKAIWSDGSPLNPDEVVFNLKRIMKSKTDFAKSLNAIINYKTLKATHTGFLFKTLDLKPSDSLFNQFGSIFLSIVSPEDVDKKTNRVFRITKTLGPYKIEAFDNAEISLIPSSYFQVKGAPLRITIRRENSSALKEFLGSNRWNNYVQTTTFLPQEYSKAILESKLPTWSRGHDRVALLRPLGKGKKLEQQKETLLSLGYYLYQNESEHHYPMNVIPTRSLQPREYPLFQEIDYKKISPKLRKVTILAQNAIPTDFLKEYVDQNFKKIGVETEFKLVDNTVFLSKPWSEFKVDYVLFSFGVADPEPNTWLSLVLGSEFIQANKEDIDYFKRIIGNKKSSKQILAYKKLLNSIGLKGGYLPLLHGSTLSIGENNISFHKIDKLDETVDFSKIEFIQ